MINLNRLRYILSILSILAIASYTTSCIEEGTDEIKGKGNNNIRVFGGKDKLAVAPTITSTVKLAEIWRDATSESSLNESVTVTFSVDPQFVSEYNEEHGTSYEPMDIKYFSFTPASMTFAPGEFKKELEVTLNAAGLDLSKDYGVGIKVNAPEGWHGAGDTFVALALPSAYEGSYHSSGIRYNYNSAGDANTSTWPPTGWVSTGPWDYPTTNASTLSSKTVAVHAANSNGGFGRINITVTAETVTVNGVVHNLVSIEPNGDITLTNFVQSTHHKSTYNPNTKTFELYYEYTNANGTFRNIRHVLVKN
jgi:hypothetical protein